MPRPLHFSLLSLLLGSALLAQDAAPIGPLAPRPSNLAPSCGLQQEADGSLLAVGSAYKATFAAGQLVFTPALGAAAAHDLPLAMTVTHVGRGELAPVGTATTARRELLVEFVRDQMTERFEVRPDGLKQSFVFAQLPPGGGDLVVRARFTSELRPERAHSDGQLALLVPGVGGVTIGQVVGIDARGRRTTGSLRCSGDTLDFVLPADFVAQAALPLIVDPLLAPLVFVSGTLEDDTQPVVAHLGSPFNQYMIVWKRTMSVSNSDILAQRYFDDLSGNSGSLLSIEASAVSADTPRVVSTPANTSWFVCWRQASDILGVKIFNNGIFSSVLTLAGGPDVQTEPDLGGDGFGGQGIAIAVWCNQNTDSIESCRITLTTNPPTVGPVTTLVANASATQQLSDPVVSRSNQSQNWLLSYGLTNIAVSRTLRGQVFGSALAPVGVDFPIAGGPGISAVGATIAGDGLSWVVAYVTIETGPGLRVQCNTVRLGFGQVVIDPPRILTPAGQVLNNPTAAWFGESVLIGCTRTNGTQNDALLLSIDPFTCLDCESTIVVDTAGNAPFLALCSRFQHPPTSAEGLVVWVPIGVTSFGNLNAQRVLPQDGITSAGSGACGQGSLHTSCARVGNANFAVRLRVGPANTLAFAVVSTGVLNFVCGPCIVVPDFSIGVVDFVGATSPLGDAAYALAIPANPTLSGQTLATQFAYFGTSCLGTFQLSQGRLFTIE